MTLSAPSCRRKLALAPIGHGLHRRALGLYRQSFAAADEYRAHEPLSIGGDLHLPINRLPVQPQAAPARHLFELKDSRDLAHPYDMPACAGRGQA